MSNRKVLLVVEDDPDIATLIALCFDRTRYAITPVETIEAARIRLAASPRPDCVILDVGLPDGCGMCLCQEMKAADPALPVAILTAGAADVRQKAQAAGADVFIAKPFEPDVLCTEIERLLS